VQSVSAGTPTEGQMAALKAVVLAGFDLSVDKIARWRIVDLCRRVERRWASATVRLGC
jgi:hypothetical protein